MMAQKLFSKFFNEGSDRTVRAKKSILFSFFIKCVSIASGLLMVPLTIDWIDQSQYGIWLTLSSLIAWLSFFDLGFANGLRNKFAESKARGDDNLVKSYVSTTYGILAVIFLSLFVVFLLVHSKLNWSSILNAPIELQEELTATALIVFGFFCSQIILNTISTILLADQKPAWAAFISTSGQVISLGLIYLLTISRVGSLTQLAYAVGLGPFIVLVLSTIWFFSKSYGKYAPSIKLFRFSFAKDIMSLGVKFFIIQIAVVVVYQTTNLIIAQVSAPENVTVYNIAFKYFSILTMLFSIIITPFWSAFTEAMAMDDYLWMKKAHRNLLKIVFLLMGLMLIMLFVSDYIFKIWVGHLVKVDFTISCAVALFMILNIWNMLHSLLLNGMGKIKLQLYVSLIGTVLNIPMAMYFGKNIGVAGVILSSIILSLISAIYAPYQVKLLLKKTAKGIWDE